MSETREPAVKYLWSFLGLPYRWAGDDSIYGFDCSGLVIEVLKGAGLLSPAIDLTANGLYIRYNSAVQPVGQAGCLVFWFNPAGIATHVEMMIDEKHTIGASGGGSSTTSADAAAAQNAFVKVRPVGYRGSNYRICDPFK